MRVRTKAEGGSRGRVALRGLDKDDGLERAEGVDGRLERRSDVHVAIHVNVHAREPDLAHGGEEVGGAADERHQDDPMGHVPTYAHRVSAVGEG